VDISSKDDITVNLMKETSMRRITVTSSVSETSMEQLEKGVSLPRYYLSAAGFWIDIYRQCDWFFITLDIFMVCLLSSLVFPSRSHP
jgi:hypothetical protein